MTRQGRRMIRAKSDRVDSRPATVSRYDPYPLIRGVDVDLPTWSLVAWFKRVFS